MTDEEKIKAMRLARAIASDISLYNEQKIIKGIEQDNLFDVLKDELNEGRDLYRSRVSQEVYTTTNFFDRAVVDIIVRSKAHVQVEESGDGAPGPRRAPGASGCATTRLTLPRSSRGAISGRVVGAAEVPGPRVLCPRGGPSEIPPGEPVCSQRRGLAAALGS